jgi:hypothetical protein
MQKKKRKELNFDIYYLFYNPKYAAAQFLFYFFFLTHSLSLSFFLYIIIKKIKI